jgi:hypothetical protein
LYPDADPLKADLRRTKGSCVFSQSEPHKRRSAYRYVAQFPLFIFNVPGLKPPPLGGQLLAIEKAGRLR